VEVIVVVFMDIVECVVEKVVVAVKDVVEVVVETIAIVEDAVVDTILKIKVLNTIFFYYYIFLFLFRYLLYFLNNFVLLDVVVSVELKCFLYEKQLLFSSDSIYTAVRHSWFELQTAKQKI
jgi:hypothetical protein